MRVAILDLPKYESLFKSKEVKGQTFIPHVLWYSNFLVINQDIGLYGCLK